MNSYKQTKLAYEQSAKSLGEYWDSTGPRLRHIELVLKLAASDKPAILELGCGTGRDASVMVKKTKDYVGIDYSSKLISIARGNVPEGKFILGDMVTTQFPKRRDIVIAFASLIHLDKIKVKKVFEKVRKSLRIGGIFYISAKEGNGSVIKSNIHGTRTYYLYKESDLVKIAGNYFELIFSDIEHVRDQDWVEIAFKRVQ